MACYNFDTHTHTHEVILIIFGRNVTEETGYQKMLYILTSRTWNRFICFKVIASQTCELLSGTQQLCRLYVCTQLLDAHNICWWVVFYCSFSGARFLMFAVIPSSVIYRRSLAKLSARVCHFTECHVPWLNIQCTSLHVPVLYYLLYGNWGCQAKR